MRHRCDYVVIIISSFTSYLTHKTLLNKLFGVLNVTQNILKMYDVFVLSQPTLCCFGTAFEETENFKRNLFSLCPIGV